MTKPTRPAAPPDPLLRGVVMVGIDEAGTIVAKLYDEPREAQRAVEKWDRSGRPTYTVVALAKTYQVVRRTA